MEQTLTARIGDAGKRLHTGRSRNDQVALDIRLTLRDYSHTLQAYIVASTITGNGTPSLAEINASKKGVGNTSG